MVNRLLYTEADVRAMPRGARLVLGAGALATPSALDAAHELGIAVLRGEAAAPGEGAMPGAASLKASPAGCPCGGRCTPGACTWSQMLSSDATYIVVVSGGRATVARMTPSGPVPIA